MRRDKPDSRKLTLYLLIQIFLAGLFFVPSVKLEVRQGLPAGGAIIFYIAEAIVLAVVMFPGRNDSDHP